MEQLFTPYAYFLHVYTLAEYRTTPTHLTCPDSGFTPEITVSSFSTAQHSMVFPPDFTTSFFNDFKVLLVVSVSASKPAEHRGIDTVVIYAQLCGGVLTTFTGTLETQASRKMNNNRMIRSLFIYLHNVE